MDKPYIVYGSPGSGSVPVEAALALIGAPYDVVGEAWLADRYPDATLRRLQLTRGVQSSCAGWRMCPLRFMGLPGCEATLCGSSQTSARWRWCRTASQIGGLTAAIGWTRRSSLPDTCSAMS